MPSSPARPIISLTTDFGLTDEYVGVMKGAILCVNPDACIVDITHGIEPGNIMEAAGIIESLFRRFPAGTIHVTVVDPGVGTDRAIIGLAREGHLFLGPDNGLLTMLLENGVDRLVRADNSLWRAETISSTFHGRDIFAPLAGHLSRGIPLARIGAPVAPEQTVRLTGIHPTVKEGPVIEGRIVRGDRFGNLITNISRELLQSEGISPAAADVRIDDLRIRGLSRTYMDAPLRSPLALIGSRDLLEIAVNQGSARSMLHLDPGRKVAVSG